MTNSTGLSAPCHKAAQQDDPEVVSAISAPVWSQVPGWMRAKGNDRAMGPFSLVTTVNAARIRADDRRLAQPIRDCEVRPHDTPMPAGASTLRYPAPTKHDIKDLINYDYEVSERRHQEETIAAS